jgi:hypothetical protein
MLRPIGTLLVSLSCLSLLGSCAFLRPHSASVVSLTVANKPVAQTDSTLASFVEAVPAAQADLPPPPAPRDALSKGVLIVISLPSQKLFVFKDGQAWGSSPVSSGRPGHATPAGSFLILQKDVHHRSTLYGGAPMPYMQRLTWGGVALHAGRLPGYPASHGCIRLPTAFARRLFAVTSLASTAVLIIDRPIGSAEQALELAGGAAFPTPPVERAKPTQAQPPSLVRDAPMPTIQLAATSSAQNAAAFWQELLQDRPELQQLKHEIIPATVRSAMVFRLRASGPEAHAICARLVTAGVACFRVSG